jgi:hypothetical protein
MTLRADEEQPLLTSGNDCTTGTSTGTSTGTGASITVTLSSYEATSLSDYHICSGSGSDSDSEPGLLVPPSSLSNDKITTSNHSNRITQGHVLLFLVTILYGSLNVALRGVYSLADPPSASA